MLQEGGARTEPGGVGGLRGYLAHGMSGERAGKPDCTIVRGLCGNSSRDLPA